jgi:hypothetical protein
MKKKTKKKRKKKKNKQTTYTFASGIPLNIPMTLEKYERDPFFFFLKYKETKKIKKLKNFA